MFQKIQAVDIYILEYIQSNFKSPFLDKTMPFISTIGNIGLIWIALIIILLLTQKYRKTSIITMSALIMGTILGEGLLKHIIGRQRPPIDLIGIKLLIPKPTTFSFPSGHTTSSFAVAGVIAKYVKKMKIPAFFIASCIAFSRLYLFVHYPSDVLAGIILGLTCSYAAIYISRKTGFFPEKQEVIAYKSNTDE